MADRTPGGYDGGVDPADRASTQPLSTRVAFRLSAESETAIDELAPLADSIDPDALDALFDGRPPDGASVNFRHDGYAVTVTGSSDVRVEPVGEK